MDIGDTNKSSGSRGGLMFAFVYFYSAFVLIRPHEYMQQLIGVPVLPVLLITGAFLWLFVGRKTFNVSQHKLIIVLLIIISLSPLLQGWAGGISLAFSKFYPIVIFYLVLVSALDNSERITKFYWLMSVTAVIFTLHGIDQSNNGVGWSGAVPVMDGRITYVGIFNDPNDLGNYFVATLPIIFFLLNKYKSILIRMLLTSFAGLVLYGVYLTNSRGAILGIAGMIWFYFASKYGFIKAIFISLFFLPLLFLAPSRMSEISANEESAAGRVDAWYAGLEMLTNSRFLGVGYGGFLDYHDLTAHNSFVLVFSELGVIGYFVWLAFLSLTMLMAYTMLSQAMQKPPSERSKSEALSFPIFYSLIGFCVTAFFLSRSYNILLYLLSALSVANYINHNNEIKITLSNNFGLILFLTIGSILFFFVVVKLLLNV